MNISSNSALFFLFGLLVLFTSCEKSTPPPDYYPNWGNATALKNKKPVKFRIVGSTYTKDGKRFLDISLNTRLNQYMNEAEYLSFRFIQPENIGDTICVSDFNLWSKLNGCVGSSYHSMLYYDVGGDQYDILPEENNYVILTSWNPETDSISGKFQSRYYFIGDEHVSKWMEDTMHFEKGRFNTWVEDLDNR